MIGTFINIGAVLVGGMLGLFFGSRLSDHLRKSVVAGLGLFTLAYGLLNFLKTQNALIVLGSLLVGVLLGEWWKIEEGLQNVGRWLELHFSGKKSPVTDPSLENSLQTPQDNRIAPSRNFVRGFFNRLAGVLCWANDHPGFHSEWSHWRLQFAGDKIGFGWICSIGFCFHAWSGSLIFSDRHLVFPRGYQPSGSTA